MQRAIVPAKITNRPAIGHASRAWVIGCVASSKPLALAALASLTLGCSMCEAPYDYCAATIGPNGQPTGGFLTRQGSVLGGTPGVPYNAQAQTPTPAKMPTQAQPPSNVPTPATPPDSNEGPMAGGRVTRQASATMRVGQGDAEE